MLISIGSSVILLPSALGGAPPVISWFIAKKINFRYRKSTLNIHKQFQWLVINQVSYLFIKHLDDHPLVFILWNPEDVLFDNLVGGLVAIHFIFPLILGWNVIIPIDDLESFSEGWVYWPTKQQCLTYVLLFFLPADRSQPNGILGIPNARVSLGRSSPVRYAHSGTLGYPNPNHPFFHR